MGESSSPNAKTHPSNGKKVSPTSPASGIPVESQWHAHAQEPGGSEGVAAADQSQNQGHVSDALGRWLVEPTVSGPYNTIAEVGEMDGSYMGGPTNYQSTGAAATCQTKPYSYKVKRNRSHGK